MIGWLTVQACVQPDAACSISKSPVGPAEDAGAARKAWRTQPDGIHRSQLKKVVLPSFLRCCLWFASSLNSEISSVTSRLAPAALWWSLPITLLSAIRPVPSSRPLPLHSGHSSFYNALHYLATFLAKPRRCLDVPNVAR
jgi:hypothetical protein